MKTKSLLLSALLIATSAFAAKRPNVLLLVADDLRAELNCLGSKHIKSPHLDRLAANGRLFTRAYCQQAVCNPSRASFLTGLRPDTIRVWDLRTHFRKAKPDHPTLPEFFKKHGYETRCVGKLYHNTGNMGDPRSWSTDALFHEGPHSADTVTARRQNTQRKGDIPVIEHFDVAHEAYWDGRIAAAATGALREMRDKPFFLAVGFWRPHLPFVAPKKYWDLYNPEQLPPPTSWTAPDNCPPIALHDFKEIRGYAMMPKEYPIQPDFAARLRHGYYASISFLDEQIGRVLGALDRLGLRDNTIVAFVSDHGFHLAEHGLWCKTSCFEYDARVPMIISAPGMKQPGKASASLAELVDLYPTLADLAGLPAPDDLEGVSLRPVLDRPETAIKQGAFTQHPRPAYYRGNPDVMGVSVATKDFRYTEWRDHATGNVTAREFYNHRKSLSENHNEADNPAFANDIKHGARLLRKQFPTR